MAWTTPRTWVTGETVTSTIMNTHVRDNLDYLYSNYVGGSSIGPAARVNRASDLSVSATTWTHVQMTAADYDPDSMFNAGNGRITIPSGEGGVYAFSFAWWYSTLSGRGLGQLYKNGATITPYGCYIENTSNSTSGTEGQILGFGLLSLAAADYVEMYTYTVNASVIDGSTYPCQFAVWRVV